MNSFRVLCGLCGSSFEALSFRLRPDTAIFLFFIYGIGVGENLQAKCYGNDAFAKVDRPKFVVHLHAKRIERLSPKEAAPNHSSGEAVTNRRPNNVSYISRSESTASEDFPGQDLSEWRLMVGPVLESEGEAKNPSRFERE
jgi:hypothetical protein